jgi:hypothetical protein
MPQNLDPTTGVFHADPQWRRYAPTVQPTTAQPAIAQPKIMSRKDFLAKLKAEIPDLKSFSDDEIFNKTLEARPDLLDKVENPMAGDVRAKQAQERAQQASTSWGVNPQTWEKHPHIKAGLTGALATLPTIGMLAGGALATPETLGAGTPIGAGTGGMVGSGLQSLGKKMLGVDPPTGKEASRDMAMTGALGAIGGAGMASATNYPVATGAAALGGAGAMGWLSPQLKRISEYLIMRGLIP